MSVHVYMYISIFVCSICGDRSLFPEEEQGSEAGKNSTRKWLMSGTWWQNQTCWSEYWMENFYFDLGETKADKSYKHLTGRSNVHCFGMLSLNAV